MDIEDVLCSKTRLKILELLMKSELLNTSEIDKQVGVSHSKAKEHLKILEDEGILIYRMFGSRTRLLDARENVSARRKHPPERALRPIFNRKTHKKRGIVRVTSPLGGGFKSHPRLRG